MKAIYKYKLPAPGETAVVEIPEWAEFIHVNTDGSGDNHPYLWAIVDTASRKTPRTFTTIGTGWEIPPRLYPDAILPYVYIGTIHSTLGPGSFVWHVFQL